MTYGVGSKSVSFTGRDPFPMEDEDFKKELLHRGCFKEVGEGMLKYSGGVTVIDKNGKEHKVRDDGYIKLEKSDLPNGGKGSFI